MAKSIARDRKNFYAGIITALAVIREADEGTLWKEIVGLCDIEELVRYAKDNDEYNFAGFEHFKVDFDMLLEREGVTLPG